MAINEIVLPRTSDAMTEAVLTSWLIPHEHNVTSGVAVAEVETEKATVEVCAESEGILVAIVPAGATVQVGSTLAYIVDGDDATAYREGRLSLKGAASSGAAALAPPVVAAQHDAEEPDTQPVSVETVNSTVQGNTRTSSPLARKLAKEAGLDLNTLFPGSGPDGRIVRADVERARDDRQVAPTTPEPSTPLTSRQRAMATAMVRSAAEIPHFSVSRTIAVDSLLELRIQLKSLGTSAPSMSAFFLRALALGLRDTPAACVSWEADGVRQHLSPSIGIAVADGELDLVVPVLQGVLNKSAQQIGEEVKQCAEDVKLRRLALSQLQGALCTISNLGMYGIDSLTPIIPPGQTFIVGIGRTRTEVVDDWQGTISRCQVMSVTLSGDHRVLTGLGAARLLERFDHYISNPVALL